MARSWGIEMGVMGFGVDDMVELGVGEEISSGVEEDDMGDEIWEVVGVIVVRVRAAFWISSLGFEVLVDGCVSRALSGNQRIMVFKPKASNASINRFSRNITTTPPGVSRKLQPERRWRGRGGGVSAEGPEGKDIYCGHFSMCI